MIRKKPATTAIHSPGCVGWWRMRDYPRRVAFDSSECGNHGHICGATWDKDAGRQCLSFNGTSDYVDCGNDASLDITDEITIAAWVKCNVLPSEMSPTYPGYLQRYGQFAFWWDKASERLQWYWRDSTSKTHYSLNSVTVFEANKWYHIVYIFDGNDGARGYIDGVQEDYESYTGSLNNPDNSLFLGKADHFFNGLIGPVRIWNRALSADEIERLYNEGK